jgi:hypothetical protein
VANPTNDFSYTKLTVHHCYFEPMVEMFSGRTKGRDLAPEEKMCPSSIAYK